MQLVIDQADMMRAVVGDDALWRPMPSVFTPGSRYYTEEGSERMLGPRRPEEAKRLLQEAGYGGERVVIPVAADMPVVKAQGDVIAEALKGIGMNVDYQAVDWGQQGSRIALKAPVDQGGWSIYLTWVAGAECANPAGRNGGLQRPGRLVRLAQFARGAGGAGRLVRAATPAAEQEAGVRANRAAMDNVPFIPTGFFLGYTAWRRGV